MGKMWKFIVPTAVVFAVAIYLIMNSPMGFKYEVVDEFKETSLEGTSLMMFVDVNKLDSSKIMDAARELAVEKISKLGPDHRSDMFFCQAYFYNGKDTVSMPPEMLNKMGGSNPNSDIMRMHLNLITEGFQYMAMYNSIDKKITFDTLVRKMLFVPRNGKAKDIKKSMKGV